MSDRELERRFEEFQATGDPRAIAEVYDLVAPQLLLLAAHLGHGGSDAEDLVQVTFLAAMEQAAGWDARRPLLPWLIGILVNQARRERRRRARRPDPDRLARGAESIDPAEAAEHAEFAEVFARKLAGLPENYRQALTLRWVHGLRPVEIAHSLGISPETVKTRLRRGTELLRQALPAGFAAALTAWTSPGCRLPSVRASVVRHAEQLAAARRPGPPGAVPRAPRGTWFGRVAWAGAAAVALATGAALWFDGGAPPEPRFAAARTEHRTTSSAGASEEGFARERIAARGPGSEASSGIRVVFGDGSPAAFATVGLVRRQAPDPLLARRWSTADRDGCVAVEPLAAGTWEVIVQRGGAATFAVAEGVPASCRVVIPEGVDVEGRVFDRDGPLAGAGIWLSDAGAFDEGRVVATTAADGSFALRDVAPGRAYSVLAERHVPRPLELLPGDAGESCTLAIDMTAQLGTRSLAGRVVDEAGEPIAGALVQLGRRLPHLDVEAFATGGGMGEHARVPPVELTTDADGRFSRDALVVFDDQVEVWARAIGRAPAYVVVPLPGGHAETTIVLGRGATVAGRIVGPDGQAAPGARVVVRSTGMGDSAHAPRWLDGVAWTDAGGEYAVAGVPEGVLDASASDGIARATAALEAHGTGVPVAWSAMLAVPRAIRGDIVDATGRPLAGLQVRALVARGRSEPKPVTTDELGRFAFEACDAGEHTLWVTDPTSPWSGRLVAQPGVLAGTAGLRLEVPLESLATAAIRGRVLDALGRPVAAQIALGHLHVGRAFAESDAETGAFYIGPLPALDAHWDLLIRAKPEGSATWHFARLDHIATTKGAETDVGDLVVEAPGRLSVTVQDRDGGTVDVALRVQHADTLHNHTLIEVTDGHGESRAIPSGDYVVHCVSRTIAQAPRRVTVHAGRVTPIVIRVPEIAFARTFVFEHPDDGWDLRLELTWCAADGTPLCRDRVQWSHALPLATVQAFEPGRYLLRAESHAGRTAEVAFEVGPDAAEPLQVVLRP